MGKSCKFDYDSDKKEEWSINPYIIGQTSYKDSDGTIQTIKSSLLKSVEYAGALLLKYEKDCTKQSCTITKTVDLGKVNGGEAMSVKAPNTTCNFHTHPQICYSGNYENDPKLIKMSRCIWGWPSGEDMRESIIFNGKGNEMHVVFSLEGVYLIHVNPYITDYLQQEYIGKKGGALINIIEEYFRLTHDYRCLQKNNEWLRNGKPTMTPQDWITYTNNFYLDNILAKENKCSNNMKCAGIFTVDGHRLSFEDFLSDSPEYILNKTGSIRIGNSTPKKRAKFIKDNIHSMIKDINKINTPGWKKGQWFKAKLIENNIKNKTISEILKLNPTPDDIYSLWDGFKKDPSILSFANKDIIFHTPKVINKGNCSL